MRIPTKFLLSQYFNILVLRYKIKKNPDLSQSPFFDMMSRTLAGSICKYRKKILTFHKMID